MWNEEILTSIHGLEMSKYTRWVEWNSIFPLRFLPFDWKWPNETSKSCQISVMGDDMNAAYTRYHTQLRAF